MEAGLQDPGEEEAGHRGRQEVGEVEVDRPLGRVGEGEEEEVGLPLDPAGVEGEEVLRHHHHLLLHWDPRR